jgi:O-antigen/teichoic acid export membrane protein
MTKIKKDSLAHNSVAGIIATAIYLCSRLFLTPYVLLYLTLEEFGLWSICFVILSYAALGAFGVNTAYIKYTAEYLRADKPDKINSLLSTGLACMLALCTLFILGLYLLLPFLLDLFKVQQSLKPLAGFMLLGTAFIFCLDLTLGCFRSLLEGMQRLVIVNKIYTATSFIEIGAILVLLYGGIGLKGMLYAYILRTCGNIAVCMLACFRLMPSLRISPFLFSREHFRQLFIYGGKMQVLGGIAMFLSSLDRMIISSMIGLAAAGMFEIGRKFPYTAKSVSGAAFGAFLPRAAHLGGKWEREEILSPGRRLRNYGEIILFGLLLASTPVLAWLATTSILEPAALLYALSFGCGFTAFFIGRNIRCKSLRQDRLKDEALRKLYIEGIRHINILNFTLFLFLIPVAPVLLRAWVGEGYDAGIPVLICLALTYMIHQGTGPVGLIFRGIDRSGRELEYLLIQLILVLAWLPAATYQYQLMGTVLAIMASTLTATLFFFWRSNFVFRVGWREFTCRTLVPGLVPLTAALVIYGLLRTLPGSGRLVDATKVTGCGILYLGITIPLLWKLILAPDEQEVALTLLPSFLKRKKRA